MRRILALVLIAVLTVSAMALASCSNTTFRDTVQDIEDIIKSTDTPTRIFETDSDASAPTTDPKNGVINITVDQAQKRLEENIGGGTAISIDCQDIITMPDTYDGDRVCFYVFSVGNGFSTGKMYYVTAMEDDKRIYSGAEFRNRYFENALTSYSEKEAQSDLMAFLGNISNISAEYHTTVTRDDPLYSGEVAYYQFEVTRDGKHYDAYYVMASEFGGTFLSSDAFKALDNK